MMMCRASRRDGVYDLSGLYSYQKWNVYALETEPEARKPSPHQGWSQDSRRLKQTASVVVVGNMLVCSDFFIFVIKAKFVNRILAFVFC
uniref:Uncharacterized protein n=1 Tax=Kalanchoe fedtschenkoi TaxID=63787 RepID=A0A7N0UZN9_KALFE